MILKDCKTTREYSLKSPLQEAPSSSFQDWQCSRWWSRYRCQAHSASRSSGCKFKVIVVKQFWMWSQLIKNLHSHIFDIKYQIIHSWYQMYSLKYPIMRILYISKYLCSNIFDIKHKFTWFFSASSDSAGLLAFSIFLVREVRNVAWMKTHCQRI